MIGGKGQNVSSRGLLAADSCGSILLVSANAARWFGYSRTELLGKPVEILVPDHLRRGRRHGFFQAPRKWPLGEGLHFVARCKGGTELPLELGLSRIRTTDGTVTLALVTRAAKPSLRIAVGQRNAC